MAVTRIIGRLAPELQPREHGESRNYSRKVPLDRTVGRLSTPSLYAAPAAPHAAALRVPATPSPARAVALARPEDGACADAVAAPLIAIGRDRPQRKALADAVLRVPASDRAQFVSMCMQWAEKPADELVRRVQALASAWPPGHRLWLNVRR